MAVKKITADLIFTNVAAPLREEVVVINEQGTVLAIESLENHDPSSVLSLQGALVPGYVNAHCHLELSHMLGQIDSGTGLPAFIRAVVKQRSSRPEQIGAAISRADEEMWDNGIVAVGDISNTNDTFLCKSQSKIHYHTFVEMFDLMSDQLTEPSFQQYFSVYEDAPVDDGNHRSASPHAPYSVSRSLFAKINQINQKPTCVSVHSLETQAELDLFAQEGGAFRALFLELGVDMQLPSEMPNNPMNYLLQNLDPSHRTLFVHNTLAQRADIQAAMDWGGDHVYWVSCPNANMYIENRLPDYQLFRSLNVPICLGTDSLSSNWQLSIFAEMCAITKYQSTVPTEDLIKWSSLNGARALGIEDRFGTIEIGKTPGLNLIRLNEMGQVDERSTSRKII